MHVRPLRFLPLALLSLLLAVPPPVLAQSQPGVTAPAPPPPAASQPDLIVTILSTGPGMDDVGVVYAKAPPDSQMKADLEALARELNSPAPTVSIDHKQGDGGAEAKLSGLTNWSTGTVNLDAIVRAYKRFSHFQVLGLFFGNFPLASTESVVRPPIRIVTRVNRGSLLNVSYEIWVDQSHGVPSRVPSLDTRKQDSGPWRVVAGLAAILVILAGGAFLVLHVVSKRRDPEAGEG